MKRITQDHDYPKIAEWLFRKMFPENGQDISLWDLRESYLELSQDKGRTYARWWYWRQVLHSIPLVILNSLHGTLSMLKNYCKITLRGFRRNKALSSINLIGLSIGLACCILIFSWAKYEMSYDCFFNNSNDIYRVITDMHNPDGSLHTTSTNQAPLAGELQTNYPEIIQSSRALPRDLRLGSTEHSFQERVWLVDPGFLDIFSFDFIGSQPKAALLNPRTIILTEKVAQKHFGNADPVGKTLLAGRSTPVMVIGVIRDIPQNSHMQLDGILPLALMGNPNGYLTDWGGFNFKTYIQLAPNIYPASFEPKIKNILKLYMPTTRTTIRLQSLPHIHLYNLQGGGLIRYIYIFLGMALFTLLIASINYMNLATARSTLRAREIGVRKVIGAKRIQLVRQFLSESLFFALTAALLAVILVHLFLPGFQKLTGRVISIEYSIPTLLWFVFLALATGLMAGFYPAFFLSNLPAVRVLKGRLLTQKYSGSLRKTMVVFQYSLSIFLIIITLIVSRQVRFLQNHELGYKSENILCLQMDNQLSRAYSSLKQKLTAHPQVLSMTRTNTTLDVTRSSATSDVIKWEGQSSDSFIPWLHVMGVDTDFQKTYAVQLSAGRFFSPDFPSDRQESVVLNEAAIQAMNMKSPIGKRFHFWDYDATIIGIVKDFNFNSLHNAIEPLVMKQDLMLNYISIRIKSDQVAQTIQLIKQEIDQVVPGYNFAFEFLDDRLNRLYTSEQTSGNIIRYISLLAIFISSLGLLGLAAFTTEQKTKEIGIRKIMGASTAAITRFLTGEYLKWVILANVIAWPAAYYASQIWLKNFVFRTPVFFWEFLLAAIIALFAACLTVGGLTIKSALADPVTSLRQE